VPYEAVAMAGRHCLPAKLSPAMEATVRHAFFFRNEPVDVYMYVDQFRTNLIG
jgi:hypothetical protein